MCIPMPRNDPLRYNEKFNGVNTSTEQLYGIEQQFIHLAFVYRITIIDPITCLKVCSFAMHVGLRRGDNAMHERINRECRFRYAALQKTRFVTSRSFLYNHRYLPISVICIYYVNRPIKMLAGAHDSSII